MIEEIQKLCASLGTLMGKTATGLDTGRGSWNMNVSRRHRFGFCLWLITNRSYLAVFLILNSFDVLKFRCCFSKKNAKKREFDGYILYSGVGSKVSQ